MNYSNISFIEQDYDVIEVVRPAYTPDNLWDFRVTIFEYEIVSIKDKPRIVKTNPMVIDPAILEIELRNVFESPEHLYPCYYLRLYYNAPSDSISPDIHTVSVSFHIKFKQALEQEMFKAISNWVNQ